MSQNQNHLWNSRLYWQNLCILRPTQKTAYILLTWTDILKNSYNFNPIRKTACILWIWSNLRIYLGGGALTWKGSTKMCGPQDCLFTPLLSFTRPPVEARVHSQDPYLKAKCDISPPKSNIFRTYEAQIQPQVSSKNLKIVQNISFKTPFFYENLFTSPHFHGNLSAHKPPSLEILASHTYQENKSPGIYTWFRGNGEKEKNKDMKPFFKISNSQLFCGSWIVQKRFWFGHVSC